MHRSLKKLIRIYLFAKQIFKINQISVIFNFQNNSKEIGNIMSTSVVPILKKKKMEAVIYPF